MNIYYLILAKLLLTRNRASFSITIKIRSFQPFTERLADGKIPEKKSKQQKFENARIAL